MLFKIPGLAITDLKNATYLELMLDVAETAKVSEGIQRYAKAQADALAAKAKLLGSQMEETTKSQYTAEITELDKRRDQALIGSKEALSAATKLPSGEMQEAAKFLTMMAKLPKLKVSPQYDQQTGEITVAVNELLGKYAEQTQRAGLMPYVLQLKDLNDQMCELLILRDTERGEQGKSKVAATRKELDTLYRDFIDQVNALDLSFRLHALADQPAQNPFQGFINHLLGQIDRFKREILRSGSGTTGGGAGEEESGGGSDSNDGETGGSTEGGSGTTGGGSTGSDSTGSGGSTDTQTWPVIDPDDLTVYTGTLHDGSTYYTVSGTVNTPIDIPAPEEGTMWPTNMPSVMPPCDFTAYTMPIDSDVTTLYKLEYKDGDEVLRTDYLPAGDIVFLYAAPDGKHWTNTPRYGKMPARDWTVYTQDA